MSEKCLSTYPRISFHSSSVASAPLAAISSSVFFHSSGVLNCATALSAPWHGLQALSNAALPGPLGSRESDSTDGAGVCADTAAINASKLIGAPQAIAERGIRAQ